MEKYYKVFITMTSKKMGANKEGYNIYNTEEESFSSIKEAKKWLSDRYNNCKKVKIYRDKKDGTSFQSGWLYCYKDYEFESGENYFSQDWIEIKEVKEKIVL